MHGHRPPLGPQLLKYLRLSYTSDISNFIVFRNSKDTMAEVLTEGEIIWRMYSEFLTRRCYEISVTYPAASTRDNPIEHIFQLECNDNKPLPQSPTTLGRNIDCEARKVQEESANTM